MSTRERPLCSRCGKRRVKFVMASEVSTFGPRLFCNKCANAMWEAEDKLQRMMSRVEALQF